MGPTGAGLALDYLPFLRDTALGARVALTLKGGTTVDTIGFSPDSGYTIEMAIDLTKLGYPPGLGDRSLFLGINLMDGDSFGLVVRPTPTRRASGGSGTSSANAAPSWAYLDPNLYVTTDVPGPQEPGALPAPGQLPEPVPLADHDPLRAGGGQRRDARGLRSRRAGWW